ncbi:MAG: PCYCGC motif-containing (lipo)protein [Anaerolineae bacterium]|nr:PCYCGC motif-containing (lipo)protein [Anaerolineae bacterium]
MKRIIPLFLLLLALAPLASGCSNQAAAGGEHAYQLAPLHEMPSDVQNAPRTVREAYQFAVANPGVLHALPCYCGCGAMGHVSNYSCYVAGSDSSGQLQYDNHALGCQICVDITQDAMRMLDDGRSVDEIVSYVDETYSRFGPATPLQ